MLVLEALLVALFLLPAYLVAGYYLGLMAAHFLGARARCAESDAYRHSFAIVIPAHNEEKHILDTLDSCFQLDYPRDRFQVFVVADNCSDRTAGLARQRGARCLERRDPENPGKGQALEWAFPQVLSTACDAIVVLDADCLIDGHALRVFDQCLEEGSLALQANYVTSNPDASTISYVARVGNIVEYELFYAPKSQLGLAVMLVGTGMVFHRELLEQYPWSAQSVTEDAEYTLTLAQAGVRIRFVANVGVRQEAAERLDQLQVQRRRWARGTLGLGRSAALKLIVVGLARTNMLLADFGWTLLVLSRPLTLLHAGLTVVLAGLLALTNPNGPGWAFLVLAGLAAFAHVVYYSFGVAVLGLNLRRACLLLAAPLVVARLTVISLRSLFAVRDPQWERTLR